MDLLAYSTKTMENMSRYNAFLMAGNSKQPNPMTIGWGQIGISCQKPVFTIMVRQSRYTKELVEKNPTFTVSIPCDDRYKEAIGICGKKSGRDMDKVSECNLELVPSSEIDVPGVKGCLIYECRVIYKSEMCQCDTSEEINKKYYPEGNYHTLYTGEILNIKESM